ncbi:VPLPA-CTERM sorting domain-containing protein [uncultured Roseobacter sp.]|uniref:VPLPA-CTERM sorting domain-containing protein n=1 Tax=uncultured Roseobacter sp. TaxID=114847 RepID=UPI00261DAF72|nr:VPLPA-CTERM sorting domain-containing protein [uncultured Roseobacter sp.]
MRKRIFSLVAGFAVVLASTGGAATFHNASVVANCGEGGISSRSETLSRSGLSFGVGDSAPVCAATAVASANSGTVRVLSEVANPALDNVLDVNQASARASASVRYSFTLRSDFIGVAPVPVSINLHATGMVTAENRPLFSDQGAFLNAGQRASASLRAFGAIADSSISQTFEEVISVSVNAGEETDSKSLEGSITTPKVLLRPGETGSITFGLASSAGGFFTGTTAKGVADASNSLSFALQGDVFNLPDGYFIDIDEPRIVNNRYTALTLAPVPLPASAWLLAGALAGLRLVKRRFS